MGDAVSTFIAKPLHNERPEKFLLTCKREAEAFAFTSSATKPPYGGLFVSHDVSPRRTRPQMLTLSALVVLCWGLLTSVTRAVKLKVPSVVGVPVMAPLFGFRFRPAGSDPLRIDHV